MLAAVLVSSLVLAAALAALVRDATRLRRSLARLERRIVALEADGATTLVIEPSADTDPPPRPRNALVN